MTPKVVFIASSNQKSRWPPPCQDIVCQSLCTGNAKATPKVPRGRSSRAQSTAVSSTPECELTKASLELSFKITHHLYIREVFVCRDPLFGRVESGAPPCSPLPGQGLAKVTPPCHLCHNGREIGHIYLKSYN